MTSKYTISKIRLNNPACPYVFAVIYDNSQNLGNHAKESQARAAIKRYELADKRRAFSRPEAFK